MSRVAAIVTRAREIVAHEAISEDDAFERAAGEVATSEATVETARRVFTAAMDRIRMSDRSENFRRQVRLCR